jgi:hypothetical protein
MSNSTPRSVAIPCPFCKAPENRVTPILAFGCDQCGAVFTECTPSPIRIHEELCAWLAAAQSIHCARCGDDGTIPVSDEYGFPARDHCPDCFALRRLQAAQASASSFKSALA